MWYGERVGRDGRIVRLSVRDEADERRFDVSPYVISDTLERRIVEDITEIGTIHGNSLVLSESGVVLNKRGLFNVEQTRTVAEDEAMVPRRVADASASQPEEWDEAADGAWVAPEIDNPDAKDRFAESFGGNTDSKPYGPNSVGLDVTFAADAALVGLAEHATNFVLKPDTYRLYNLDVFEYELDLPMALYGHTPYVMAHTANRSVGFLWLNAAETFVTIGEAGDTHWVSESGIMDLYVLPGPTVADVHAQLAELTGVTPMPPTYAFAYHQCKWNYKSAAEVAQVHAGFDEADIPFDVLWLDIEHTDGKRYFTWDTYHFPDPIAMQDALAAHGRKLVTIVDPHIKRDGNYYVHKEALALDAYVRKADNSAEFDGHCWPGSSSWPDYTRSDVREWWASLFALDKYQSSTSNLLVWNDMNEPSVFSGPETTMPKDLLHANGVEHRDVHNLYGALVHRATFEGLKKRDPEKRAFVLTRAFFAGTQRTAAVWTGDNLADWGHLAASVPMLLSLGASGIPFVGADVGGFFGDPDPELLTRWYQLGALQPFFRAHGHLDSKRREPFLFEPEFRDPMRDALRLRYSLLPYFSYLFKQHETTGLPINRPLFYEFPGQADLLTEEVAFMLGNALLFKPVVQAGQESVSMSLPAGSLWYDYRTSRRISSEPAVFNTKTVANAPPLLQRGGTIIATRQRARRSSTAMTFDPITLQVALDDKGAAVGYIYLDDGESSDANAYSLVRVEVHSTGTTLSVRGTVEHNQWADGADIQIERIVVAGDLKLTTVPPTNKFNRHELKKPGVAAISDFALAYA
jgi:alpha 1,3-glucosidase